MTFLAGLAASLIQWFITKLAGYLAQQKELHDAYRAIDERTDSQAKAVTDAQTEDDLERAAKDLLSRR